MKKILIALGCCCFAVAVYAASTQMKNTGAGLQIGTAVGQKVGFYGATPVVRQTVATTAPVVYQVSNVDGSTNAIACLTSNQLAQILTALTNLGLSSTNGQ